MTAWVGIGIALMFLGVFTSVWVVFLGACVIGSTPVFFTLRAALAPPARGRRSPGESLPRAPAPAGDRPARRRVAPPRRRDHG